MYYIYGKEFCKYCEKAKNLLLNKYSFIYIDLDDIDLNNIKLEDNLERVKKSNMDTIPIIFWISDEEDRLVGGYDDLVNELNL